MSEQEKKEQKKQAEKTSTKILDENDELACGFCSFCILDQDGYGKKTKGSAAEAPWHLASSEGDVIVLQADLPANALFFLQISNEENTYFFGEWWLTDTAKNKHNQICDLIPQDCKGIHKSMDGDATDFEVQANMPLLQNSSSKLVTVKVATKEQKFITKAVRAELRIPKSYWQEWKQRRLVLWKGSKSWKGEGAGGDDDDKEGEKKDKDD